MLRSTNPDHPFLLVDYDWLTRIDSMVIGDKKNLLSRNNPGNVVDDRCTPSTCVSAARTTGHWHRLSWGVMCSTQSISHGHLLRDPDEFCICGGSGARCKLLYASLGSKLHPAGLHSPQPRLAQRVISCTPLSNRIGCNHRGCHGICAAVRLLRCRLRLEARWGGRQPGDRLANRVTFRNFHTFRV